MRSIFGWSYPPGCSGPPDDHEGPCDVCGLFVDDCICAECSECSSVGDPKCYEEHGLVRTQAQIETRQKLEEQWKQEAADEAAALDRYFTETTDMEVSS